MALALFLPAQSSTRSGFRAQTPVLLRFPVVPAFAAPGILCIAHTRGTPGEGPDDRPKSRPLSLTSERRLANTDTHTR